MLTSPATSSRPFRRSPLLPTQILGALVLALVSGCGNSTGGLGGQAGIVGQEADKPGGGTYFVDENESGQASDFLLSEVTWGRLVDIHQLTTMGAVDPIPVWQDFVINETIQSDGVNYRLETNPITQRTRLVILENRTNDDARFLQLVNDTQNNFPFLTAKNDDGTAAEPFSFVARNSCLVLRFNDLLEDDADALDVLANTVKVGVGYPPTSPHGTRIFFDPNHGGVVGNAFHSTRVLVDFSITLEESDAILNGPDPNILGLPASLLTTGQPNLSIRIPTEVDFFNSQFDILTNLRGEGLDFDQNGPRSFNSTMDIVRALRAGRSDDDNNGFLLDNAPPRVVGGFPTDFTGVFNDPLGTAGFDFLANLHFTSVCQAAPLTGDLFEVNGFILEVTADAAPPNPSGDVLNVACRSTQAISSPGLLQGSGDFLSSMNPALSLPDECFISFVPPPAAFPATGVSPNARIVVRFSEPMDPDRLTGIEDFLIVEGTSAVPASGENIVIGQVTPNDNLTEFTFDPTLPLNHTVTVAEAFHTELGAAIDLSGRALTDMLAATDFTLDSTAPTLATGGFVWRFNSEDELGTIGAPGSPVRDLRGQANIDTVEGVLRPRGVEFLSFVAEPQNPLLAQLTPTLIGSQEPLTPQGALVQWTWRYCDFGMNLADESLYNIDILGMSWSPFTGAPSAERFEAFEINLTHSGFLPDEAAGASAPATGLAPAPMPFSTNVLSDPMNDTVTVHSRALGYTVNPSDTFSSLNGTVFAPFPLNRGAGTPVTYTWRDTAILSPGGPGGGGAPINAEATAMVLAAGQSVGSIYGAGAVRSIGLPLLVEARCFPSNTGLGMNRLNTVLIAPTGLLGGLPATRAFSAGGLSAGSDVIVQPDLQNVPTGGFNPFSGAPWPVTADGSIYIGALDTVSRVSRVYSIWLDAGANTTEFFAPVLSPDPNTYPVGTDAILEFRGATGFTPPGGASEAEDASFLDAYGDLADGNAANTPASIMPEYLGSVNTWTDTIGSLNGAQFIQVRMTFVNNIAAGTTAEISALGIPFRLVP